ncbi:MAG: hypothetical protein AB1898_06475 [Acidobacteriota bacterium]
MMTFLWLTVLLPTLYWDGGPETAPTLRDAGVSQIAVPPSTVAGWRSAEGITVEAVDTAKMEKVPAPSVQMKVNEASATRSPWIDSNGWRYLRQPGVRFYGQANGSSAALAAVEAYVFGAELLLHTDPAGLKPLGKALGFLSRLGEERLPDLVNIGYRDDGSEESAEVMNMLVRRNLLFTLVTAPNPTLDLNVQLGSNGYPIAEGFDPSEMAQKVRTDLTDAKRLVRIYGSEAVIARLGGNAQRVRVHLLNYAGLSRPVYGLRLRVRGQFERHRVAAFEDPGAELQDYLVEPSATEFTLAKLGLYAVIDLFTAP